MRWVGHALLFPVWLVVLGLLTVVVAHVTAYDQDHLFFLANSYTLWLFLPAYPIAVAALCFRAWPLALTALVIVIAHLVWVVPPTFRTVAVTPAVMHGPKVRIASANVRYDNLDHGPLLAEMRHTHADVIVMEEITPAWWKAIAASGLLRTHPFFVKSVRQDPGGMVMLSRHPLTHVVVHHAGGWPIITATVELGGAPSTSRACTSSRPSRPSSATDGPNARSPGSPAGSPARDSSSGTSTPAPTTAGSTSCSTSACATRTSRSAAPSPQPGRTVGTWSRPLRSTTSSPIHRSSPSTSARDGARARTTARSSWTWPSRAEASASVSHPVSTLGTWE